MPKAFRKENSLTGAQKKELRLGDHKIAMPNFRPALQPPADNDCQSSASGTTQPRPLVRVVSEAEEEEDPLLDDSMVYELAQRQGGPFTAEEATDTDSTLRRPVSFHLSGSAPTLRPSEVGRRPTSAGEASTLSPRSPRSPPVRPRSIFVVSETERLRLEELKLTPAQRPDSKYFDVNTGELLGTIDPERQIEEVGSAYDGWKQQSVEWAKINLRQIEKRPSLAGMPPEILLPNPMCHHSASHIRNSRATYCCLACTLHHFDPAPPLLFSFVYIPTPFPLLIPPLSPKSLSLHPSNTHATDELAVKFSAPEEPSQPDE